MPHRGIFNLKEIGFLRSCRNRTDALTCAHSLAALVPGCPGKGKKMLLHSVMRKKPDNFLSRHCHYSMFRRRGCKEKPPFLQIFLSFCCGQQNGSSLFISELNFPFCSVSTAKFEQLLHFRLLRSRKSKLVHQIRYYVLLLQILLTFIIV